MEPNIKELSEQIKEAQKSIDILCREIGKVIVGQKYLMDRLIVGLLADGHILIEGVPGLAKTMSVRTLSQAIQAKFQRIQFTPDLLPADLIGTLVYSPKDGSFSTKKGPIFANIILADEINRAPSKVQSALLEAMQEHQVTIGENTFKLPEPFLVLATQNPIEQEGTYPLPEAQVDRFMMKLIVDYPNKNEEKEILNRMSTGFPIEVSPVVDSQKILELRKLVNQIYIDEKVKDYIVDLVFATRFPAQYKLENLKPLISYGASPRASIMLTVAAKAHAFLQGRGYATPEDVKLIGNDVLRHRILVTYEAEAEGMTSEKIIEQIFDQVEVP
ncbi:MAG: ATPase [Omnitrophica bacterium RIFCSPLOWO2_12_FULL_44_17]|uniref:ATPase n=1 Tax=Candidatus Danuiimicrobium aquiferis TaxID=1801832 RepID=A0A1G1KZB4_9BACT|nr:MAG: ATPase [Omnitrophica bacterium RIFCSPHIGHO2_02_FULL_45_28]OGW90377.1 MAG: ATPase [Omnitrophica bacterium RIFCSPHIGHO2_12_FULL_44_12]OGW97999.1 MAG: ATPase [Omnitrophica bacterium RIFCSPLOWO2_12_FULL_44_17]OGX03557.1 MAG: ATPase [Omnitrophica bacterium RIFCSPLOWO2_02_FULL_44_11]